MPTDYIIHAHCDITKYRLNRKLSFFFISAVLKTKSPPSTMQGCSLPIVDLLITRWSIVWIVLWLGNPRWRTCKKIKKTMNTSWNRKRNLSWALGLTRYNRRKMSRVTFEDETSRIYRGRHYPKDRRAKSIGKHSGLRKSQDEREGFAGNVEKMYSHQKYKRGKKVEFGTRACNPPGQSTSRKSVTARKKPDRVQGSKKARRQRSFKTTIELQNSTKVAKRRSLYSHSEFKAMIQPSSKSKNKYFPADI